MINTLVLDRESKVFTQVSDVDAIDDLLANPANVVWVDASDPTSVDFTDLAREFGFHPLAIEDCRHEHQRPKVEEYQGYYFIVLYEAQLNAECELELRELNIFLGKNYLVTVHSRPIRALAAAERLWRTWTDLAERGSGLLAHLLIDAIVDEYLPLLDVWSDKIDEIEERIFGDFQTAALQEVLRLKKQLIFFRRVVVPLRDVFNTLLRREQPVFSRETTVYFQDVFDHLIRVADTIDALREMLGATMEAYLSVSGYRMNLVMKRLTALSAILMSVTLLAGIYGMNFDFMPELGWRYGYIGALGAMVLVGLAIYYYFRRINWL